MDYAQFSADLARAQRIVSHDDRDNPVTQGEVDCAWMEQQAYVGDCLLPDAEETPEELDLTHECAQCGAADPSTINGTCAFCTEAAQPPTQREVLIERLLALPGLIHAVETWAMNAETGLRQAEQTRQEREDELLLGGLIDGKNAETRAAQIRRALAAETEEVEIAHEALRKYRVQLQARRDEFAGVRAASRLLERDGDA